VSLNPKIVAMFAVLQFGTCFFSQSFGIVKSATKWAIVSFTAVGDMTRPAKEIVNTAIKLTESERLQIVEELLANLEPVADDEVDPAWTAEVERRSREIKEGTVHPIPWEK
jgi:putative addiction module component (TIGR02574 family)